MERKEIPRRSIAEGWEYSAKVKRPGFASQLAVQVAAQLAARDTPRRGPRKGLRGRARPTPDRRDLHQASRTDSSGRKTFTESAVSCKSVNVRVRARDFQVEKNTENRHVRVVEWSADLAEILHSSASKIFIVALKIKEFIRKSTVHDFG